MGHSDQEVFDGLAEASVLYDRYLKVAQVAVISATVEEPAEVPAPLPADVPLGLSIRTS